MYNNVLILCTSHTRIHSNLTVTSAGRGFVRDKLVSTEVRVMKSFEQTKITTSSLAQCVRRVLDYSVPVIFSL